MSSPRLLRRYDFERPRPLVVEIHDVDCDCPDCEPPAPSVPPRLNARAIAVRVLAGTAFGHALAFVILGPATAWRVLVAALTWSAL